MQTETKRLWLARPTSEDTQDVHQIFSDPRVWTHAPSKRHSSIQETEAMLNSWNESWERDLLGPWIVREANENQVIGYGGCSLKRDTFWNLGYRFAVEAQGRGYATEVALEASRQALLSRPDLPIIAFLLEHNEASARIAQKVGLELAYRGSDIGNVDGEAIRLIYADRNLNTAQLEKILLH